MSTELSSLIETDSSTIEDGRMEGQKLAKSIGEQVRIMRNHIRLTMSECALQAGLSVSMLSKIENGTAQPSLTTLHSLSKVFNVPLTTFFKKFEENKSVSYTPPGEGILIERHGTKIGHQYYLLGQDVGKDFATAPHLITFTDETETFPLFQHTGVEFIYMLEGDMDYQLDGKDYNLVPGTSLFFEADVPHGPVNLNKLPIKFLSVIIQPKPE